MTLATRKIRLILDLRRKGITDTDLLAAIERVPRECFVPDAFVDRSYEDTALPIGHGQTISQPSVVARMIEALTLDRSHKVLEIGTGSGYQTAVLSHLCRRVYTIERHGALLAAAERRFAELRRHNITGLVGDGAVGWPQQAPFPRIVVAAASRQLPVALIEQLAPGGIMVVPLGPPYGTQSLVRVRRRENAELATEDLGPVRFVPLIDNRVEEL